MDRPRPVGAPVSGPRRVFTAPVASAAPGSPGPSSTSVTDGVVETLYVHPSAKIVAFTAGPRNFTIGAKGGVAFEPEPGSLPWSSQLERTIAVGSFCIYRAPGSVAFLSCGSALQPILPKSQCWCIDEVSSKFILQIRRPQYWRIEIPVGDTDSDQRAQTLRLVLDQVLQFEKTPCPFQRAFTVVLPARPQTPVKKRPWTPVQRTTPVQLPPTPVTPVEKTPKARTRDDVQTPALQLETPTKTPRDEAEKYKSPPVKSLVEEIELRAPEEKPSPDSSKVVEQQPAVEQDLSVQAHAVSDPRPHEEREEVDPLEEPSAFSDDDPSTLLDEPSAILEEQPQVEESTFAVSEPNIDVVQDQEKPHIEAVMQPGETASSVHPDHDFAVSDELPRVQEESRERESLPTLNVSKVQEESEVLESVEEEEGDVSPTTLEGSGLMRTTSKRLTSFARLQARRSVTAPPQLTLHSSPPSKVRRQPSASESSEATESNSPTESFHSVQSWLSPITPLPPSPPMSNTGSPETFPYPHENIRLPKHLVAAHQRDTSEATATPTQAEAWGLSPTGADILSIGSSSATSSVYEDAEKPDAESDVTPDESQDDTITLPPSDPEAPAVTSAVASSRPQVRHRPTTTSISLSNRHRALSPLPPAANLFSPSAQRRAITRPTTRLEAVRRIPGAIIHKTCEILLSPPSHLINLMLKVAARIAAGEWRGLVFGQGQAGEHIPVQWDYTDHSDAGMYPWAEDDDDFAPVFRRRASVAPVSSKTGESAAERESRPSSSSGSGRSWEVD